MTDPLTRAKQLVALAVNPGAHKEEARTAAHKACLLIAEHKLLDPPPPAVRHTVIDIEDIFGGDGRTLFDMMQDLMRATGRPPRSPQPPRPPQPPTPPAPPGPSPYTKPSWMADTEWKARVDAVYEELRRRAPRVPEPTLRRAAESTVLDQIRQEQDRHQRRAKR